MHQDSDILAASNLAGGLGYVVKGPLGIDLVRAIDEALAGHSFVSPFLRSSATILFGRHI